MLQGSSEVAEALGAIARREGQWDQSIEYFEQALALDPRNVELLMDAAWTYAMLRQFPPVLKLYDRSTTSRQAIRTRWRQKPRFIRLKVTWKTPRACSPE